VKAPVAAQADSIKTGNNQGMSLYLRGDQAAQIVLYLAIHQQHAARR